MPNMGIESATLRSLARRSNQLSYAAAIFTAFIALTLAAAALISNSNLRCILYTGTPFSIVFRVKYPLRPIHGIVLYAGIYGR